jgi:hypothetical protein
MSAVSSLTASASVKKNHRLWWLTPFLAGWWRYFKISTGHNNITKRVILTGWTGAEYRRKPSCRRNGSGTWRLTFQSITSIFATDPILAIFGWR